jgi:hypothetical protein
VIGPISTPRTRPAISGTPPAIWRRCPKRCGANSPNSGSFGRT